MAGGTTCTHLPSCHHERQMWCLPFAFPHPRHKGPFLAVRHAAAPGGAEPGKWQIVPLWGRGGLCSTSSTAGWPRGPEGMRRCPRTGCHGRAGQQTHVMAALVHFEPANPGGRRGGFRVSFCPPFLMAPLCRLRLCAGRARQLQREPHAPRQHTLAGAAICGNAPLPPQQLCQRGPQTP